MGTFIWKTFFLIVLICATVNSDDSEEYKTPRLIEPNCTSLWLLVELPVAHNKVNYKLSTTHALVRRCMGANNKRKACVSIDEEVKIEKGYVENVTRGTDKTDTITVSWVSHENCEYQRRKDDSCPIEDARKCLKKSSTHYYDEHNCTCTCIVNIDGEDTCPAQTLMQFSLDSDLIVNTPKSKKEKLSKKDFNKKCWHLPNLLAALTPPRLQKPMGNKKSNQFKHTWPLLDPIEHLIIEAGTSFIILRWHDPLTHNSGVTIEAFRINWMSENEKIKSREIEESKMEKPERKICIQDLRSDTDYAVAIFIKLKSEDFFSRPTIRTVKTLSRNGDSMVFQLGDIGDIGL